MMDLRSHSRPEWLAMRQHCIGGSEVAAVLGVSPYETPWELWARKTGTHKPRHGPERQAVFDRGHQLEPVVLDVYSHVTGRALIRQPAGHQGVVLHPEYPWLLASVDALAADEPGIVDAKTSFDSRAWGRDDQEVFGWGDGAELVIPPHIALQGYMYMACTGREWCDFAVLSPPTRDERWWDLAHEVHGAIGPDAVARMMDYRTIRLCRDERIQADMLGRVVAWHERHILVGEEPEIGGDSAMAYLSERHPGDPRKRVIEATPDVERLGAELVAVSASVKELSARAKQIKTEIAAGLGDAYKAVGDFGSVVYTLAGTRSTIDTKRLQRERPEIASEYTRETTTVRSVRIYGRRR